MKTSVKTLAMDLFSKNMNVNQAWEELTKQGIKAKKSTLAAYFTARNKAAAPRTSAKVVKTGAAKTGAKIKAAQKARTAQATRGGITQSDVIDWVYTNTNLVASKRREITNLILN